VDVEVLAVKPHAHYRAREIRGTADLPDGTSKSLIYIKDWDFHWQQTYQYKVPVALPKGTRISMRYTYDNSSGNPRGPRPVEQVRWGPLSRNEMADLWIQVLPRNDHELEILTEDFRKKGLADDAVGYETMLQTHRDDALLLHDDLAAIYSELGQPDRAVAHLRASILVSPRSAAAHYNLALALARANHFAGAIGEYSEALNIDPTLGRAHFNLARLLDRLGRTSDALDHYGAALRLNPRDAGAHNNIGLVLMRLDRLDDAMRHFAEAVRFDPRLADAHYNLALALEHRGHLNDAIAHFRRALELRPEWPAAIADLCWVLSTAADGRFRDSDEAIRLGGLAVAMTKRLDAEKLDVLAAAYASAGRFDEAAALIREAIDLAPEPALVTRLVDRQKLYLRREPYRQPPR
jgi:tetratricopeptide (TPR) repeat protein